MRIFPCIFAAISLFSYTPPTFQISFFEKNTFGLSNSSVFQIESNSSLKSIHWQTGDSIQVSVPHDPFLRQKFEYFGGDIKAVTPVLIQNLTRNTSAVVFQIYPGLSQTGATRKIIGIFPTLMNLDDSTQWGISIQSQLITIGWAIDDLIMMGIDPISKAPIALNISRGCIAYVTEL